MNASASGGALDGLTLFRFAHMERRVTGGGVEACLWNLNRTLLQRNRMRILQMYLTPSSDQRGTSIEPVGRGELVWVPSLAVPVSHERTSWISRIKARLRKRDAPDLAIDHRLFLSTLSGSRPTLGALHWISDDSAPVVDWARRHDVRYVVVNHFNNSRLERRSAKALVSGAVVVGGVSAVNVPRYLSGSFVNLSDAIDTDFFDPDRATPIQGAPQGSVILLPARVCREKGHLEAVSVLSRLRRCQPRVVLVFAGREETPSFSEGLRRAVLEAGLEGQVVFAGEQRNEDLRSWYAASDLVLLPSASEGLGRVLLEAQAMNKPVVAYDSGGVREAVDDGVTGYLVTKGDVEAMAGRIEELLRDRTRSTAMGRRGRAMVLARFSPDSLAARHERFYLDAIG